MLSVSNLTGSGSDLAGYFEREAGQKDYWAQEAQEATCWHGHGAHALGLAGAVDQATFENIMDGQLPTGTQMPGGKGGVRRMGYDLTFSAPKSVSLQGLVAGDARVLEAHDKAVGRTLDWLEQNASQTQIKANGEITITKTDNLVAAVFRHETSRELDPQLHSHAVVANLTRSADGKWRALENSEIYKLRMTAGAIYRAELAAELQRHGYQAHQTTSDGRFEIDGFTKPQLDAFSTRRKHIEDALAERGLSGAEASEQAALMTRQGKQALGADDKEAMRAEWRERAESLGINTKAGAEKSIAGDSVRPNIDQIADNAVIEAAAHLSERSSTFEAFRMRQIVMQRLVGTGRIENVQPAIDRAVQSRQLLAIETPDGVRYAMPESLHREIETVAALERGRGATDAIADLAKIEAATEGLNAGQAEAARLILTSHDRIAAVQGYAGSGKTYMLNRVAEVATAEGYTVQAIAPTASAAETLGKDVGKDGKTLAAHLLDRSPPSRKELWIVDEAGLISTTDMHRLLKKAERVGAKVALVGDTQQLKSVEAGQPFKALQQKGMAAAEMSQVLRHNDAQLAEVVNLIRQGKGQEAVAAMRQGSGARLDWVQPEPKANGKEATWEEKRQARLTSAADKYMQARASGGEVLLVAERRDDRAALNSMVRDRLIQRGEIQAEGVKTTVLVSKDLTRSEARLPHAYSTGDTIEFGRTYKSIGVEKGERLTIQDIDYKRGTVQLEGNGKAVTWNPAKATKTQAFTSEQVELAGGDRIAWTRNDHGQERRNGQLAEVLAVDHHARSASVRLQNGQFQNLDLNQSQHLDHAHAVTVYKSQGRTVDHVIVASNTSSRESAYVAVSRARESAEMVVNSPEGQAQAIEREQGHANVLDHFSTHEHQHTKHHQELEL